MSRRRKIAALWIILLILAILTGCSQQTVVGSLEAVAILMGFFAAAIGFATNDGKLAIPGLILIVATLMIVGSN